MLDIPASPVLKWLSIPEKRFKRGAAAFDSRAEVMANHKSAIKRIRQNAKRREYNRAFRSRARTFVKKARVEIAGSDLTAAEEATRLAIQDLDKAASKGVIHKRNAARRKSRLMQQLNALKTS